MHDSSSTYTGRHHLPDALHLPNRIGCPRGIAHGGPALVMEESVHDPAYCQQLETGEEKTRYFHEACERIGNTDAFYQFTFNKNIRSTRYDWCIRRKR